MQHYDLNIFSPIEFEGFSRDLLQAKFGCFIESFKQGKDGGIDLRFTTIGKVNVIQAKRSDNFRSLLRICRSEVAKVEKLAPASYILTTSIGLSPDNKRKIRDVFSPYIKSTEDIYGKDDLLNILSQNRLIEIKYYKLWLGSINVLERVLHNKIFNYSQFELDEIVRQSKIYVENESFHQAVELLKRHHYIIITGIPGIGKTTLARVLVQYYLTCLGYEEFIFLGHEIDNGWSHLKEDKRQVFLFDDFLGRNSLDCPDVNKFIGFFKLIERSPNRILILTCREYLLNQAKEVFEEFKTQDIEIAKSTVELSCYTPAIRMKILYNHLYHGKIPRLCVENLVEDRNYNRLINHTNFNPRIIEYFINYKIWTYYEASDFTSVFENYFDNPESVWLHSFENSLDEFSQYILLVLITFPTPVLLEDLEQAVETFFAINPSLGKYTPMKFYKSIRRLQDMYLNTIISTKVSDVMHRGMSVYRMGIYEDVTIEGRTFVEYQNPSIYDFIYNYLIDKEKVIGYLIDSFGFVEQFYTIFSSKPSNDKIVISLKLIGRLSKRLLSVEGNLAACEVNKVVLDARYHVYQDLIPLNVLLAYLYDHFAHYDSDIEAFVYRNFSAKYSVVDKYYCPSYMFLMENLDLSKFKMKQRKIIESFLLHSYEVGQFDLGLFEKFSSIFPKVYKKVIKSKYFENILKEKAVKMVQSLKAMGVLTSLSYDYYDRIRVLMNKFNLDLEKELSYFIDSDILYFNDNIPLDQAYFDEQLEKQIEEYFEEMEIDNLFRSLNNS